jgi:hypothetical protein
LLLEEVVADNLPVAAVALEVLFIPVQLLFHLVHIQLQLVLVVQVVTLEVIILVLALMEVLR